MPSGFEFIMPKENDRACRAPPGFIPIYYHMHRGGFRLPLLRFQRMIIREFNVLPSLLLRLDSDERLRSGQPHRRSGAFNRLLPLPRLSSNVNAWAFSAAPGLARPPLEHEAGVESLRFLQTEGPGSSTPGGRLRIDFPLNARWRPLFVGRYFILPPQTSSLFLS